MEKVKKCVGLLLLLAGLTLFMLPDLYSLYFEQSNQQIISSFQRSQEQEYTASSPDQQPVKAELYRQFEAYNQELFSNRQSGLSVADVLTNNPFPSEFDEDLFGYISIPVMEVELPLYLGASDENMSKGAVVLGETSLPIGGVNTNSVIAGHRGYRGAAFFREIERLQVGDSVFVTNPWETLEYTVTEIALIQPDDVESIRIQDGKDLLTLMTCHPYRSHGKYRYLVYCEGKTTLKNQTEVKENDTASVTHNLTQDPTFVSSEQDIQQEKLLRVMGLLLIVLMLAVLLIPNKKSQKVRKT